MTEPTTIAAPSAAPTPATVTPAGTVTPAPVAAAPAPSTLNEFAELARKSLAGELPAAPASAAAESGQEPSPELAAVIPAEPAPELSPDATGDEPTAEEKAAWTAGEIKLHGALVKERAESKVARQEARELKAKQAELESKINALTAPKAEPTVPAAQPSPVSNTGSALSDCQTFEAVDARVLQAATTESQAVRLQNMLNRNGVEPVAAKLLASGVDKINGIPTAEASADDIGEFLAAVYEGSRTAQAQAVPRKNWLAANHKSLADAVEFLPALRDPNSPEFAHARTMVSQNPLLRNRPDWPMLVVKNLLGTKALEALVKPAATPAAAPVKVAVATAKKAAPGASKNSIGALPVNNGSDVIAAKMKNGTATLAEVQEYTRAKVVAA